MNAPPARAVTIPDWKYSCTTCGKCCRDWHVFLSDEDLARLKELSWGTEIDVPAEVSIQIDGHPYLAHRDNGACIYLEEDTNLCRIHSRFGEAAKPLGCRIYPWNLVPTFAGEYSAIPRLDCPPARRREGALAKESAGELRQYIGQLGLRGGFDKHDLEGLPDERVRAIVAMLFRRCATDQSDPVQVGRRILIAAGRLEVLGTEFLTELDLDDILPSMLDRVNSDALENQIRRLAYIHRWNFASLLAGYLRRDEELLHVDIGGRVQRAVNLAKLIFGKVDLRGIGKEHPAGEVYSSDLYVVPIGNFADVDWGPWLEMVRLRLQSYQFMGQANYGLSLYDGLKSLALTFPLVLAAAKWSALARGGEGTCRITADDVDYAVGAIDHSYGRSAYLSIGLFRKQARQLSDPHTYRNLLNALVVR